MGAHIAQLIARMLVLHPRFIGPGDLFRQRIGQEAPAQVPETLCGLLARLLARQRVRVFQDISLETPIDRRSQLPARAAVPKGIERPNG